MKLSEFNFNFPKELIAEYPSPNRDEARLMVVHRKTGKIEHKVFKDILSYYNAHDVFIINNTKVFPARLFGRKEKTGAKIEVFLLRELNKESFLWDVLVDPARKIRIGNKLYFGDNDELVAEVIDNTTSRGRTLRFLFDGTYEEFKNIVYTLGETPLPKYIKREVKDSDKDRYQTVYAEHRGSVAAPTAGLHFTPEILDRIRHRGIETVDITLHVGLGTFQPIRVEHVEDHQIHSERYSISADAASAINHALRASRRVIAVGTTTVRTLEQAARLGAGSVVAGPAAADLFIYPGFEFKVVKAMLTNFHLPQSTLLMLVCAFGGRENVLCAYEHAVCERYRFYSYGDCMFIE